MRELVLLTVAGGCGAIARYGLSGIVQRWCGERFAWGTLGVNLAGCFLFGLVWTLAEDRLVISGQTRFIILTGFMGAFTTFSTFAFETCGYLDDGQWKLAIINVVAQNGLGILSVFLGMASGRLL
jgi:CrcB protein